MNQLSSKQRKLVYLVGIALLAVPIIWLGEPAGTPAGESGQKDDVSGGKLAQMRQTYDLGETSLGKVDPSSATMNFVLFGFRGLAASQLWQEAIKNQETKNWGKLESNVNSIILLQPHFVKVWEFQSWNLAYNVSGEWDLVEDKYFWIKKGAKFGIRGTRRNSHSAGLYWWIGVILGDKIARHDAWMYMRKFFNPDAYAKPTDPDERDFRGDPEEKRKSGGTKIVPDPELNPSGKDNYLVAREWFLKANEVDLVYPQHRMASALFRQRPARSQIAYAEMLQREGRFDEKTTMMEAWREGLRQWKEVGKESYGSGKQKVILADSNGLRNLINYNYWLTRAQVEMTSTAVAAHRLIYEGKAHLRANERLEAVRDLEAGLNEFGKLLHDYPELRSRDESVEEVMVAILAWKRAKRLLLASFNENTLPVTNPPQLTERKVDVLRDVWVGHQGRMEEYKQLFHREFPK